MPVKEIKEKKTVVESDIFNASTLNADTIQQNITEDDSGNSKTWKPNGKLEGTWTGRVLPPLKTEKLFYKKSKVHYIDGKKFYCLKTWNEKCPACEQASDLWDGNDKDGENSTIAKSLFQRDEFLSRFFIKEDNTDKPVNKTVLYEMSKSVFDKCIERATDKKTVAKSGMFYNPYDGRDTLIKKKGKGRVSKYDSSTFDESNTPLLESGNKEEINELLLDAFNTLKYEDVIVKPNRNEMLEALDKFLSKGRETEGLDEENTASTKTSKRVDEDVTDDKDVEDADIDDLVEDLDKED